MIKTKNDINKYQKIKYHERKAKAKFVKNLLTGLVIIIAVLFFWYATDVRGTNEKTANTVSGLRIELNSLRKTVQDQFNSVGGKLQEQDKKIDGVRQSKADQVQKQSLIQVRTQPLLGGCEQYQGLVAKYNWNVAVAMAIMQAESGCNTNSLSRTGDRGLMQINWVHSAMVGGNLALLFDPETNMRIAYQLYQTSSWYPWSAYKNGSYLKFL